MNIVRFRKQTAKLCVVFLLLCLVLASLIPFASADARGGGQITPQSNFITPTPITPTPTSDFGEQKDELDNQLPNNVIGELIPPNDDISFAEEISGDFYSNILDTTGATIAPDDPYMGCGLGTNSNTVWYRFTAPSAGKLRANTIGSNYDTVLAAFTGIRGALEFVACNDDFSGLQSRIEFQAQAGETYYVEVADYGSPRGGQLHLNVDFIHIDVPLDIVLLQDETGSMYDDINQLKSLAPQIWDSINDVSTAGFRMSVVGFRDFARYSWGNSTDWVYRRLTDFTINRNQFVMAVNALTAYGGNDAPEAQYVAVNYLLTSSHPCIDSNGDADCVDSFDTPFGQQPHFRSGATRIVLLATDAPFHDPGDTYGYPGPTYETVLQKLKATNTIVIGLVPGGEGIIPEVDSLASAMGGSTQDTGSSGGQVTSAIASALSQIVPVSPALSFVEVAPTSVPADGTSLGIITITLKDTKNNPVSGKTILLYSTRGAKDIIIQPDTQTNENGQAFGFISSFNPGQSTIVAIDVTDNVQILEEPIVEFVSQYSDLINKARVLDTTTQVHLSCLANSAKNAAENGDYFRGAISADKAKRAVNVLMFFTGGIEGVKEIERLRGGVQLALPGLADSGYGPVYNFIHRYPESRDLFNLTWRDAIQTGDYGALTIPVLESGGKYYAAKFVRKSVEKIGRDTLINAWEQIIVSEGGFSVPASEFSADVDNLKADLSSQRVNLSANMPPLTPEERAAYIDDINKRLDVPLTYCGVMEQQTMMLDNIKDAHDSLLSNGIANFILKFLAKSLAQATFDGPGLIAVNSFTEGFEYYINTQKLDAAQKALDQAPGILIGSMEAANKIYLNEAVAFDRIKSLELPRPVTGEIQGVTNFSRGHAFLGFFSEDVSYSEITLKNTSNTETGTFEVFVRYGYNSNLLGLPWAYIPVVKSETVILHPNETKTVSVYYKNEETGGSPADGSYIYIDVLAVNSSGTFYIDNDFKVWDPQRVNLSGSANLSTANLVTPAYDADIPTVENPISLYVISDPVNQTYQAQIYVANPFSNAIDATITQNLSAGVTVLSTDGILSGSTISWRQTIASSDITLFTFTFSYPADPGAVLNLHPAILTFVEPSSGEAVSLQSNSPTFLGLSPIEIKGYAPIGTPNLETSMPITIANLASIPTDGMFDLVLSDVGGPIFSDTKAYSLDGFEQQTLTFVLPSLPAGLYPLETYVTINGTKILAIRDAYNVGYSIVDSILRMSSTPTSAMSVGFTVNFSDSVTGVDASDFTLTTTGVTGTTITGVTPVTSITYMVTVDTGSGSGTIRLDLVDDDSIRDAGNNPLGGPGIGDGNFTGGEEYTIIKSTVKPGIPALLSPANSVLVNTLQPKLDWKNSVPAAYDYQIQVSTNSAFTTLVVDETNLLSSEFTFDFDLDPGKRYFWRVRGYNIANVASGWSTVWNFRTPLAAPILIAPPNTVPPVQLDNDRPAFDWEDVDGATQYNIQVATSSTFGTPLVSATVNASEYNAISDLPQNKTLFWRVRAKNSIVTGPLSDVWSFKTGNPPSVPVLLSPANNSAIKGYTPTLKWKASAIPPGTELDYYKMQIATDAGFTDLIADEDVVVNQFTPPDELLPGLTYYWRVRAFNKDGEYSAWSTRWSFKTRLNVFDNGVWWIKKLPPSSPDDANQYPMDVYVNGVYWGKTHRLDFGHRRNGSDYPTAAVIYNTGYVRLTPLGLPFGTSFILGPAHWDSDNHYFHNLQISRIDINTASAAPSGPLKIKITARDYNEVLWPLYHFDVTHQITFPDPKVLKAAMTVTQTYTAAADFDLSAARQAIHEGFKLAQFSSMYIDDTYRDSDGAQYTDTNKDEYAAWFKDLLCDGLVFDAPLPLDNRNPWVQSFHGDNAGWQGNTPNTIIRLANPNLAGEFVPQGYWACSADENDDNIGLWLNHDAAPASFSAGQSQSVGYLLISQDDPLPSAPGLVAPDNGISLTTNRPAFEWKDVAWETKYNLQISTAGNFSTLARNLTVTSSPFTLPTDLPRKTKLYWRVRTVGAGGTTDWSEVWSFTTGNPPSVPALVSPANNAQLATNTPTLDWYNSTNPTGTVFKYYEVEVDNDNDFSSPEFSAATTEGSIADSKITTSVLAPGTQYYWRARAVNLVGGLPHYSGWSVVRSFRTP